MILPMKKRWIHFQGLLPLFFCLIFFDAISHVMRARGGGERRLLWKFSSWIFSALPVKEQLWCEMGYGSVCSHHQKAASVSLAPLFPLQTRAKPVMHRELPHCPDKSTGEKTSNLLYLKRRDNLLSKLKKEITKTLGNLGVVLAYLVNISGFFCARPFVAKCNMLNASCVTACSMLRT